MSVWRCMDAQRPMQLRIDACGLISALLDDGAACAVLDAKLPTLEPLGAESARGSVDSEAEEGSDDSDDEELSVLRSGDGAAEGEGRGLKSEELARSESLSETPWEMEGTAGA
eukprot:900873-Pleurochrysis_carterae.AAC.1